MAQYPAPECDTSDSGQCASKSLAYIERDLHRVAEADTVVADVK
jgi:hypothetical protein